MFPKTVALLGLACTAALAQTTLSAPRVGYLLDDTRALRPVLGTAANFLLGEPVEQEVLAAASSGRRTMAKKAAELVLFDQEGQRLADWPAPGGPALFAFGADGAPAAVYFPETRQLARIEGGQLLPSPIDVEALSGEVVAMASPACGVLLLMVRREENLWQVRVDASTAVIEDERVVAADSGPLLVRPDGTLVYGAGDELVVRGPDAAERRLRLAGELASLAGLGDGWVLVRMRRPSDGAERRFALRLDGGEDLYELPRAER
jgi:hypothetical protein